MSCKNKILFNFFNNLNIFLNTILKDGFFAVISIVFFFWRNESLMVCEFVSFFIYFFFNSYKDLSQDIKEVTYILFA